MAKLNLSKHPAAQDMVKIIMKEKGLSAEESLDFSITQDTYNQILNTGWASIALDLWGHGDPDREWEVLDKPIIDIEFDKHKQDLINEIVEKEKVSVVKAVSYCLIFAMQSLGYHI